MRNRRLILLLPLLLTSAAPLSAALANAPHEDIHFLAEHLPELAQDARYFSLPWPGERPAPGRWQPFVGLGWNSAKADFLKQSGSLLSFGSTRGWSERSALTLFGFYDRFDVSGGSGEQVLRAPFAPVPLDLPERARFSSPGGTFTHYGVGAAWTHGISPPAAARPTSLEAGLIVDRLILEDYRMSYRVLGGRDASAEGVLDHSSEATFFTPFVGFEKRFALGGALWLIPRVMAGAPLPPADFDGRLSGPGFDVSSADPSGKPGKIGDGFVSLGAGLLHRRSGLELDLGAVAGFPLFESATHPGVDQSFLVHLVWRHHRAG
jgi:hypothetical protein